MGAALQLLWAVFSGRLTTYFMCRSSTCDIEYLQKKFTVLHQLTAIWKPGERKEHTSSTTWQSLRHSDLSIITTSQSLYPDHQIDGGLLVLWVKWIKRLSQYPWLDFWGPRLTQFNFFLSRGSHMETFKIAKTWLLHNPNLHFCTFDLYTFLKVVCHFYIM